MLAAIAPHIPKNPVGLEIVGADVQYATFNVNGMLVSGYALLITCKGALLGPEYHITNAHVVAPFIPNKVQAEEMIHISCARLREAKVAQTRQAMGGQNSGGTA